MRIICCLFLLCSLSLAPAKGSLNSCYKTINGKRYYNCRKEKRKKAVPAKSTISYRHLALKNTPKNIISPHIPSGTRSIPVLEKDRKESIITKIEKKRLYSKKEKASFASQNYLGFLLGKSSLLGTKVSSSLSYGLSFSKSIDTRLEWGIQYSYLSSGLSLNLRSREISSPSSFFASRSLEDSSLSTKLFSSAFRYHFSNLDSLFRPFLGIGLFYKIAKVEEKEEFRENFLSAFSQNAFGLSAVSGLKYRTEKQWQLAARLHLFLPIFQGRMDFYSPFGRKQNPFTSADSELSSSAILQINFSAEYLF